jgi:hypothetical protein
MSKKYTDQEYEEWKEWKRKSQNLYQSIDTVKTKMDRSEPVTIPKGYLIAGIIALVALVVAAFPIMLFGFAMGAFAAVWFNSHWRIK